MDRTVVFTVSGRLDAENVSELCQLIDAEPAGAAVVLDFTDLVLADRDAIRYLRQATLHYPDSPTVHYRLSRLYSLTGQPDLARQEGAVFSRLKGYQDVRRGPEER